MNIGSRSHWQLQWTLIVVCASVHTQYAMPYQVQQPCAFAGAPCSPPLPPPPPQPMPPPPMPMPPPPMPMPPPPPIPFPPSMAMAQSMMAIPAGFAMIIPGGYNPGGRKRSTTTSTTTTSTTTPRPPRPFRIIPLMMPSPMMPPPMMPPPMMPPPMMPGPPMMMPGPSMMMPSPMMLLNYPRNRQRRRHSGRRSSGSSSSTSLSSSSSSSCEANSCENVRSKSENVKKRWNTVTRRNILRAYNRVPEVGVVKPVLSYVGPNGDVKFETKITNKEAVSLLNDKDASIEFENDSLNRHDEPRKNVRVLKKQDGNNEKLIVYTEDEPVRAGRVYSRRSFHRVAMGKPVQQYLHKGKKELVFNTPENKKITNMTLSFQVI